MNKKTQERMDRIKRESRFVKPQERGVAERIEAKLRDKHHPIMIARSLGVSLEYVNAVKSAMERRK